MELLPAQVRVLGCLIEKERTTPDNYPLTMNALLAACNQTTNRHPVVTLTEATVASAVENLRAADLLRIDHSRSNRADKYRHVLDTAWTLDDGEIAVLGVLMLRGAQTVAELRARTDRLHPFTEQAEVEAVLSRLAARLEPLVACLGRAPGQKEARWAHLLAGQPDYDAAPPPSEPPRTPRADRMETLETTVSTLKAQLEGLRLEHEALSTLVRDLAAELGHRS